MRFTSMRLIDADALKKAVITNVHCIDMAGMERDADIVFASEIDNAPTVDPVKRGQWTKLYVGQRCSICRGMANMHPLRKYRYCPWCGSRMMGEEVSI